MPVLVYNIFNLICPKLALQINVCPLDIISLTCLSSFGAREQL